MQQLITSSLKPSSISILSPPQSSNRPHPHDQHQQQIEQAVAAAARALARAGSPEGMLALLSACSDHWPAVVDKCAALAVAAVTQEDGARRVTALKLLTKRCAAAAAPAAAAVGGGEACGVWFLPLLFHTRNIDSYTHTPKLLL